jgi:hypothetical protein
MMSINAGSGIHTGPPGSSPVPVEYLDTLNQAMTILLNGMREHAGCNSSFASQSGGRTFQSMFDDHTIWINYDPDNGGRLWGWTMPPTYPRDIVICRYALRMGRWSAAATIVHELAHLNGAPGGASHAAEQRVRECRMMSPNGPYDPHVTG